MEGKLNIGLITHNYHLVYDIRLIYSSHWLCQNGYSLRQNRSLWQPKEAATSPLLGGLYLGRDVATGALIKHTHDEAFVAPLEFDV